MAVCYLFANYEVQYKCKYNITKDFIEVETDYDIEEEIEAKNGLKLLGSHTQFKERDILIIDYQNKSNFLLKNARYVGRSSVYGTPDGGRKTKFRTRNYFRHGDYGKDMQYVLCLYRKHLLLSCLSSGSAVPLLWSICYGKAVSVQKSGGSHNPASDGRG